MKFHVLQGVPLTVLPPKMEVGIQVAWILHFGSYLSSNSTDGLPEVTLYGLISCGSCSCTLLNNCASWNENGPRRLKYLNAWSLVAGTVWEGLGGVAMLEEVWQWRLSLRVQRLKLFPSSSLSVSWLLSQQRSSQLLLQHHACWLLAAAMLPTMMVME